MSNNLLEEYNDMLNAYNELINKKNKLFELVAEVIYHIRSIAYHKYEKWNDFLEVIVPEDIYVVMPDADNPDVLCVVLKDTNKDIVKIPKKFLCEDFKEKYADEIDEFIQSYLKFRFDNIVKRYECEIEAAQHQIDIIKNRLKDLTNTSDDLINEICNSDMSI
jgi:DNA gyrase/topoisomerase IV subunit A